jgi:PilZ domain
MSKTGSRNFYSTPRGSKRVHTVSGIVVNYEGQSELTFVRSPDVSARGMFVNTGRSFPEGAVLNVRFRLALSGAAVRARGEVRYSLPGVGIGLEFIDLDPAVRQLIEREVALNSRSRRRRGASSGPRRAGRKRGRPSARASRPRKLR